MYINSSPARGLARLRSAGALRFVAGGAAAVLATLPASMPAKAGHSVFHIFTPTIEAGEWGAEALTTFQSGFAEEQDGGQDDAGHEDGIHDGHAAVSVAHELAIHGGLTEFWMGKLALGLEHEKGGEYAFSSVALENVFHWPDHTPGPLDVAWFTAVSVGVESGAANSVEFGPILAYASGPVTLTLNPFFEKTFGENREDGIVFTYGWRATYELGELLSIGVEGYGEIENIAGAPAARDQIHRVGPVLYLGHVHGHPSDAHGLNGAGHKHEPQSGADLGLDLHAEIGVLFALTDATPDTAIKFNVGADF